MRAKLLLAGFVLAGTAAAFTMVGPNTAKAYGGSCLKFRDFTGLKLIDDNTAIASTRGSMKYKVTFRQSCRNLKMIDNFYTVRLYNNTECFDGDDVLQFRYGGACFVQSVTPMPAG